MYDPSPAFSTQASSGGVLRGGLVPGCLLACLLSTVISTGSSCRLARSVAIPEPRGAVLTGSAFYRTAAAYGWRARDSFAVDAFLRGQVPRDLRRFVSVRSEWTDSTGGVWRGVLRVSRDYFMVGTDVDRVRVPLTPMAGQRIADALGCFLPTRRLVDLIHEQSRVRLEPVPMYAYRDSTVTMMQHDLILEGQRRGRRGLISGIKKDVVLCGVEALKGRSHRVAIYGWHRSDGRPIQSLYTGHVDGYVDYSHGIRFVQRRMRVNGRWLDYREVMRHPLMRGLVTDERGDMMERY
jgi:hypothetical protein